jgi:putative membrane-bound dehydrogenase-like protein
MCGSAERNRWRARWALLAAGALAAFVTAGCTRSTAEAVAPGTPTLQDPRLQITVFATEPDIVTPIGIAVDRQDRVFVLESHTHLPPRDYAGHSSDRVKIFTDANRDGRPDRVEVFADGIKDGMNIAFSPDGELYVVAAKTVWVLHDRDGDGVSEARTAVLQMVRPERVYAHAALLGIAFSHDGWMYVSRGNTGGSPWRIEGTDGTSVGGYGDGGNIIRARPDGSEVHEFATGFWNPFDLKFDTAGRLLAADNDPDSRGPNRLVHVVEGGDYGYRSLYGGSGIHPYLSWNGELPGTLPYAVPLGEAPAGLFVAAHAALPPEYHDELLATIWEERRIVRVRLQPGGTSVRGDTTPLADGDDEFRPVAFAADSRGTIYITDWVIREYPNHGRGRIWRLATRRGVEVTPPRPPDRAPDPDPGAAALQALYSAAPAGVERLRSALVSDDPFVRHAAVVALTRPELRREVIAATRDADARVRLGALLALQRAKHEDAAPVARHLLRDPDLDVRRMAFVWAGTAGLMELRPELDAAILTDPPSPELFEIYLATLERLSPEFIGSYAAEAEPYARLLKRLLQPRFLESFVADRSRPVALRAIAIRHLQDLPSQTALLTRLAQPAQPLPLRREAVRSLGMTSSEEAGTALLAVAQDASSPAALRADALVGLARQPVDAVSPVLALLNDLAPAVRFEAARYLRSVTLTPDAREAVGRALTRLDGEDDGRLRAQLAFAVGRGTADHPASGDAWAAAVASGGDPEAGRRVFFSTTSACAQCHVIDRRGGDLGPDLTNVGRSKTRAQILDAILRPSAEISPEYQGWYVKTGDGQIHTGRQIDVGNRGTAELYVQSGEFITLEGIEEYGPMPRSLMPEGLETNLTVDDVRDLLAFLVGGEW